MLQFHTHCHKSNRLLSFDHYVKNHLFRQKKTSRIFNVSRLYDPDLSDMTNAVTSIHVVGAMKCVVKFVLKSVS